MNEQREDFKSEMDRLMQIYPAQPIDHANNVIRSLVSRLKCSDEEIERLTAENKSARDKLEIAYSEICFTVHDLAAQRSQNYMMRSNRLAKFADEIRASLDDTASTHHQDTCGQCSGPLDPNYIIGDGRGKPFCGDECQKSYFLEVNDTASTQQCQHPVHDNPGLVAPCPECGATPWPVENLDLPKELDSD